MAALPDDYLPVANLLRTACYLTQSSRGLILSTSLLASIELTSLASRDLPVQLPSFPEQDCLLRRLQQNWHLKPLPMQAPLVPQQGYQRPPQEIPAASCQNWCWCRCWTRTNTSSGTRIHRSLRAQPASSCSHCFKQCPGTMLHVLRITEAQMLSMYAYKLWHKNLQVLHAQPALSCVQRQKRSHCPGVIIGCLLLQLP